MKWFGWLVVAALFLLAVNGVLAACGCSCGPAGGSCYCGCLSGSCTLQTNSCENPDDYYCTGSCPTATPTPRPPTNTPVPCRANGDDCTGDWQCCSNNCTIYGMCEAQPTNTPTPTPTSGACVNGDIRCTGGNHQHCESSVWVTKENCDTGLCAGDECYPCEEGAPARVDTGGLYGGITCSGAAVYCEKMCNLGVGCTDSQTGYKDVDCWTTYACRTGGSNACNRSGPFLDEGACPPYNGCSGTPVPPTPTSYCQPYMCVNVDPGGICPYSTPPVTFCYPPNTAASCDNCGGLDCVACPGTTPGSTPNPTPCSCYSGPNPTTAAGLCPNEVFPCDTNPGLYCYGTKTDGRCVCRYQGRKVLMPGNQQGVAPVFDETVTVAGVGSSASDPYSISVGTDVGSYDVSVSVPSGYSASYTYCANSTSCHVYPTVTLVPEDVAGGVVCPTGTSQETNGYADLWWHFDPPKVASVAIGSTAILMGQTVAIGMSGNAYMANPAHTLRLWLESWSAGASIPVPVNYVAGGTTYTAPAYIYDTRHYYYFYNLRCDSGNYGICSSSGILNSLPAGNYRLHVDVSADPRKCSGNPFCSINGGPLPCTGWASCGGADSVSLCVDGEDCLPVCGQARTCGGNCASSDAATPGQVGINSPIGTTAAPVAYTTPSTNLSWGITEANHSYTDYYRWESYRTSNNIGFSGNTASRDVSSVGVTMGVGATGATYRWRVRAENNTCNGYPAGTVVGSWSPWGYYCYEGELCNPGNQCGQARDCPGNGSCSNNDGGTPGQVTILSPTGPSVGNPTVYNDVLTLNLTWNNGEVGHTYTDFYNYQVIKAGGSNPSNIGTTFYGVGSTVARTVASVGVSGVAGDIYEWKIRAGNNNCSPVIYGPDSNWGFYVLNRTPTTPTLTLVNAVGTTVAAEAYGVGQSGNHICDTRFTNRRVRFLVNARDLDGGTDVNEVRLNIGSGWVRAVGLTGPSPTYTTSGVGLSFYINPSTTTTGQVRTVDFPVSMSTAFALGIHDLTINTVDKWGAARNNVDTNRDFKNWDCQVPVLNGDLYDSSSTNGAVCPAVGYDNLYVGSMFTSLYFNGPGTDDPAMIISGLNQFSSGGNLTWGSSYLPVFNVDLDMSDPTSSQRTVDLGNLGNGTTSCPGAMLTLGNTILSAYSNTPSLGIDFSGIRDQDPWFQTVGGGMKARSRLVCNVPPTCQYGPSCRPGMTIDSEVLAVGQSDNGLVSAQVIDDNNGCDFIGGDCSYGIPNNWYLMRDIWGENYTYSYLYDKYVGGLGLGLTYPGGTRMSNIGATGVVFVDGDFEIDVDNTLTDNQFLMVIARGQISVADSVNSASGVFLADGGVAADGVSANQLVLSGMLYSAVDNISFTRGFTVKEDNNYAPAVSVNYRSSLIFNMPPELVAVLSGWREGQ